MCISDRLKQILEVKGMSIKEFSELTGISYRSAMNYLNEGRDPNVEGLVKIHESLGISITWLLTGNGAMFQTVTQESDMSSQEEKLIANYRSMPENLKEAFSISFKEISSKQ
ncbi:helix-turn-helix transcriptional regulator [Glaesserella parasuis]|uniref:Helix-turn-helix transcriptional regulator n=1 Tax=Glaesserella parasuis TaxID=738 RepID=A0AAX1M4D7_GLAPU|nr:helix-turn-helix transcriptional regulator [Glaesserella parasuis]MCT8517075.1 helix-turn-helix domain-containing protein [Glaesserella parasuis]MCT8544706.1 helix-turn-helix domain-containing protein [Glaesserella parasuis]MCT8549062.1 helix-turn-helix domain-containing protein [Glaesserella parasuis]MCT8557234.1 helix-turn-helix domain-containing protein [Glaesserella parasuis]MCT8572797.1 helix-turn-helix domain-containing protein [Glaesserella parasuis]